MRFIIIGSRTYEIIVIILTGFLNCNLIKQHILLCLLILLFNRSPLSLELQNNDV